MHVKYCTLLLLSSLLLLHIIPVQALTAKQNIVFRTSSNNVRFTLGNDLTFHRITVNSTQLRPDQSYTDNMQTRYYIYVISPSNVNLTINSWFPTGNSSATLSISAPNSTNIAMGFYSPEMITASVTGAVSQTYTTANKTLNFKVNTDTFITFIIHATITEIAEDNITPENNEIVIIDMEGCGPWVFSEESYYTFRARYWDGNGYGDLDTVEIGFTDGVNWINASYDVSASVYTLTSGAAVVNLKAGTTTIIDSNLLQVTFLFYFETNILDANNVDIFMQCNDTSGDIDSWEKKQTDYFNIYSLGGHATYEINNNAGRLKGGDVFDLWAQGSNDTSSIIANLTFRNLQHIKLLPIFDFNTSINGGQVTYMLDYCINDNWVQGLEMEVRWSSITVGTNIELELQIRWFDAVELIKSDFIYMFHQRNQSGVRSQTRYWIDLWFNKINASTTMGARINAYEYSMTDSSNPWLRWLTGSNWGANYSAPKQSMCFIPILDADGNLASTKQIDLIRVRCKVAIAWIFGEGQPPVYTEQYVEHRDLDVFDLTLGTYPLTGVQTPVFDETRVPLMPQSGLLGAIVSALSYLGKLITDALGVGLLGAWDTLVGFLDTIAAAMGAPGLFTFIFGLISQAWAWFVDSMAYLISLILIVFNVLTQTMGKGVNVISMVVTQWLAMFQTFLGFLGGTYTAGINVWNDLSLWTWLTLAAILYPLYLAEVWATKGMDAAISQVQFLLNVFSMLLHFLFTVIQWAITLVTSIIESIPIAE